MLVPVCARVVVPGLVGDLFREAVGKMEKAASGEGRNLDGDKSSAIANLDNFYVFPDHVDAIDVGSPQAEHLLTSGKKQHVFL